MSLMATSATRSSVFTFESTVHSSHVLRCLDEQRRRDTMCDVTVVVEGQSFRAHRAILASCSEYLMHRISSFSQHGAVVTLPKEVTVAGFEPLLKFAYTSKLLFEKHNVLEIRNSASILGFNDLDKACFDFLLPKFFSSSKSPAPVPRKTCCKKICKRRLSKGDGAIDSGDVLLFEKEVKPVADSPTQQEVTGSRVESQKAAGALTPSADGPNERFTVAIQCPKYRKFQLACGKETCVPEKSLNNPVITTVIKNDCERPANSPFISTAQSKGRAEEPWKTEPHDKKKGDGRGGEVDPKERQRKWNKKEKEMETEEDISPTDGVRVVPSGRSALPDDRSSGLMLHRCPMAEFGECPAITRTPGHKRPSMDGAGGQRESAAPASGRTHPKAEDQVEAEQNRPGHEVQTIQETGSNQWVKNSGERSAVEGDVSEHLAKQLGFSQHFQDPEAGRSSDGGGSAKVQDTSLEWLKYHNLSSTSTGCPFYQELDQSKCSWKGVEVSEGEGADQSGVSSPNSGDDGDSGTETEGDSESYTRERARQVQLPFSVEWIVDLNRNDFQQLLKQQVFTQEQLEFVHDMRRRSKNRLAAQRCRKRKLECINDLQCEINKLKTEREKLMMERSHLSQLRMKTCHSVSALCQKVCNEAKLQPDQLQAFAQYTSSDCPLSSLFPHIDSLVSQPDFLLKPHASLSACFGHLDMYTASEEAPSSSRTDTVKGDGQRSTLSAHSAHVHATKESF
ncbi:transcription regulator protein BACH1b [Pungitius pungitius]|uniref:transcription regulator protein BACH1b n=1 Tax=Pungitius pungitius TaxID=134920 RepID=UPI002E0E9450